MSWMTKQSRPPHDLVDIRSIASELKRSDLDLRNTGDAIAFGLGILALSLPLARRFGRFNGGHVPGQP